MQFSGTIFIYSLSILRVCPKAVWPNKMVMKRNNKKRITSTQESSLVLDLIVK